MGHPLPWMSGSEPRAPSDRSPHADCIILIFKTSSKFNGTPGALNNLFKTAPEEKSSASFTITRPHRVAPRRNNAKVYHSDRRALGYGPVLGEDFVRGLPCLVRSLVLLQARGDETTEEEK